MSKKYALAIEYDGSRYCGWQSQKHCLSVQAVVEKALSKVANETIEVVCAGRTDSGVHARAQVVHFETSVDRPDRAWLLGVNSHMDRSVSVHWVKQVDSDFHARYSALNRSYRYVILNRRARPGLQDGRVGWVHVPLDEALMHDAGQYLLGEHDFSAFRAAGCQANHARREIQSLCVSRNKEEIYMDITANAFLHNMVRIITGNLIKVGRGDATPASMGDLLASKDRTLGGITAVPDGLYFFGPKYPEIYKIPDFSASYRVD